MAGSHSTRRPRAVVCSHTVLESCAHSLSALALWVETRAPQPHTPLLTATLQQAVRAKLDALATLRVAERLHHRDGQPQTAAELALWDTVEFVIASTLDVRLDATATGDRLAAYYACERTCWLARPSDFSQWSAPRAARWARSVAETFMPAPQPRLTVLLAAEPRPAYTPLDDDLDGAVRDEMHRRGEREPRR